MIISNSIVTHTVSEEMHYEGTPVLKYEISRPELISNVKVTRLNEFYSNSAKKYQEYCRSELYKMAVQDYREAKKDGFPVHEYEAVRNFSVTANEGCVFSLYTDTYEYTGGAHGNTARTSQSWQLPEGRRITLDGLFPANSHYRAALVARIIAIISRDSDMYFDDYAKLVGQTFDPESFYLTPDGLAIYFQQYDIAPYAHGIPVFEFTYDEIGAAPPRCVR